jgi:hypothetical protein
VKKWADDLEAEAVGVLSEGKGTGLEAGSNSTGSEGWVDQNEIVTLTSSTSHSPAGTV